MLMKRLINPIILLCVLLAFSSASMAQIKVKGLVTDQSGQPVPGVSVVDKGTTNGTITNLDGKYSIDVSNENATLTFSFIGFKNVEEIINGRTVIDVVLVEDVIGLDEVVAVGYGTMKKSDLTGAIVSVKSEDLQASNPQSLDQALQGRAAGVHVSTTSAAPGGTANIRIRGTNSLLSDGNPLYIIDGFPVEAEDINNFNVNDIKSVEILKDASSTAIYGSRGANGVILITTDAGKVSKPKFNFNSNIGFQELYRSVALLNGEEFAEIFNEYLVNNGDAPYYDGSHRDRPNPEDVGEGTNWFDQITKPGFLQNYNLSVQGGSKSNKYRVSGAYYNHDGVILGGDFTRYNLNVNNDIQLNDWINVRTNVFLSRADTNGSGDRTGLEGKGGTLNSAIKMSPVIPVYDEHGNYYPNNFPGAQSDENPVAYANETLNNTIADNVLANLALRLTPIKDLQVRIKVGTNIKHQQNNFYLSSKTIEGGKVNGQAAITNAKTNYWINENIVSYNKKFKKHKVNFTGGFTMEERNWESNRMSGTGIPDDEFSYAGISYAEVVGQPIVYKTKSSLMSFLGRVAYNFDDRYLVTLTNRTDGNSGFAEGNKWGNFPSVSAAWRISQEKFMLDNATVSNLKLRVGYGVTGNSRIGNYRSMSLMGNDRYVLGGGTVSGISPTAIGNKDLRWETTEMYNVGLDVGILNNRVSLTAEAYYKYTTDMLMSFDIPGTSGYKKAYINAGELENKGMEFSMYARIFDNTKFKWNMDANIAFNRDKVAKLYNDQPLIIDLGDKQSITITEGKPIREFKGPDVLGVFKDWDEVNAHTWVNPETGEEKLIQNDAQPGDLKYRDNNNDGKIDGKDNVVYGSAFPDYTFGINNQVKYANFTFDLFINGSQGNWVQNRTLGYLRNTQNIRNNLSKEFVNRWTEENTVTDIPRLGADQLPNIEDASYVRIQTVKLTYDLPRELVKAFDHVSVFASIDNLYVWTKYSGWDPDVNSAVGGEENVNVGQDTNSYPRPRTYRFGVNLKF